MGSSGGSINLERGVQSSARSAPEIFRVATPTFGHVNAFKLEGRTEGSVTKEISYTVRYCSFS